jgi:major vault protein
MADERRDQDIVLAPNEYMFILDKTKGYVDVFVGPNKQSLSPTTDQPVVFDEVRKQFAEVGHSNAKQLVRTVPEGWYIVLKNPAPENRQPTGTGKQSSTILEVGKKVNIPGPVSFPLWPGQMAKVLKGHHLRSNQYLIGRVYDDQAARANWKKAVVKPVVSASTAPIMPASTPAQPDRPNPGPYSEPAQNSRVNPVIVASPAPPSAAPTHTIAEAKNLVMGQLLIIKGTDVSFYIPPTGVEIIPNDDGELVREAVTLERLEYCLLMDENGNKRYERGPMVVFPEPTEVFATKDAGEDEEPIRKFNALDLNENSGIYIKVIAEYSEGGKDFKVGDELFITGKDQMIYFPREEHAIVKYDKSEIHYGIAIPSGEARYVLNRNSGIIDLVKGPRVFLPDPRTEVVVRRILDWKFCNLLYPNNVAAATHNAVLAGVDVNTYMNDGGASVAAAAAGLDVFATNYAGSPGLAGPQGPQGLQGAMGGLYASASIGESGSSRGLMKRAARGFSGTSVERKTKYTEPRSITLPTKFDGALSVDVWTGYAVKLVTKSGDRRIVQGPKTVLLEYDEMPEIMELSTGKPKTTDNMFKTAYLRVKANKSSDIVMVETSDYCEVEVKLSYRMNFTGDPEKWFDVENYVKFMCDHLRSRLKSEARKHPVQRFYSQSTEIVRSVIVGTDGSGTKFEENGMHVYDVEVLSVKLRNPEIEKAIVDSQKDVIRTSLRLSAEKLNLLTTVESEDIKRRTAATQAETKTAMISIDAQIRAKQLELDLAVIEANAKVEAEKYERMLENEVRLSEVSTVVRLRSQADAESRAASDVLAQKAAIEMMRAEVESLVARAGAISGDIVAALQGFSDKALVEKITEAIAPMSLLGGGSVTEIMGKVFQGTSLAQHLLPSAPKNGSSPSAGAQVRG